MFKLSSRRSSEINRGSLIHWMPARFLAVGGCALICLGTSGALGIFSYLPTTNVLNPPYWINWVHIAVGCIAVLVVLKGNASVQQGLTMVPAALGSALGIGGLVLSLYTGHAQSGGRPVDLSDHITHLCVGAMASWALWSSRSRARGSRV